MSYGTGAYGVRGYGSGIEVPAFTLWNRALGDVQGRIEPVNQVPSEGDFVFCLGSDLPGLVGKLNTGDFVEVSQTADFGVDTNISRVAIRLRPSGLFGNFGGGELGFLKLGWKASIILDGAEYVSRRLEVPGGLFANARQRDLLDMGINVSQLVGNHTLAFRLELLNLGGASNPNLVELPAFYLDQVIMDESGSLTLFNRDPEPNETQVPASTRIDVDIADTASEGIVLASTQVFVNGVLAFDAGSFQTGFNGLQSGTSNPDPDTLRIKIDPTSNFLSQQLVTIRVLSETTAGASTIDESYSFTIEDLTPAVLVSAVARELRRVRLTFNEPVQQISPTTSRDALDPANYAFVRLSAPAVNVVAVKVETVTDSIVDVLTDIDVTPGGEYQVDATGIADLRGNVT